MRVLFFGRLRDVAGAAALAAPPDTASLTDLRGWIAREHSLLAAAIGAAGVRVAVDGVIVPGRDAALAGVSEVAFMPPMSGG